MSASAAPANTSRSRTQARKKVNDDASYFGPPSTNGPSGTKRQAADKADTPVKKDVVENDPRKSLVDFHKLSIATLHRYMIQFDIIPGVYPSPLSPEDPPAPPTLCDPQRQPSRGPSPPALTPANRPRRDPKEAQNRRRSSRLVEEEPRSRTPILADVVELHSVLATIVERHFREVNSINNREVDILAAFMCAVGKSKDKGKTV
ncbi:unnamed protein product [Cyclocybe aegerita]|uniref:Histone deacetylase complex subunit SAP30 Sin3 binding domain-containing protein n=1 Tax=Cyclocybe aegerita TaxID=1973307 RepID=A0A8S0WJS5_CYCAE|nr:unnamed protein product [Cyclocybe aegerita]